MQPCYYACQVQKRGACPVLYSSVSSVLNKNNGIARNSVRGPRRSLGGAQGCRWHPCRPHLPLPRRRRGQPLKFICFDPSDTIPQFLNHGLLSAQCWHAFADPFSFLYLQAGTGIADLIALEMSKHVSNYSPCPLIHGVHYYSSQENKTNS